MDRREFLQRSALAATTLIAAPMLAFSKDQFPNILPEPTNKVFERLIKEAKRKSWSRLPIGNLTATVGMALLDTPYVAFTLERSPDHERVHIDLTGLDCVTFYEYALAIARMLKKGKSNDIDFVAEVLLMRYRRGDCNGYDSRLHYTTDWIFDNVHKGVVVDLTPHLPGAKPIQKHIDFMSTHPASYKQLKDDPDMVAKIKRTEEDISVRKTTFIPKDQIAMIESLLEDGDIIGMTSSVDGLDTNHTGLCYRDQDGALRYLNASSTAKKVIVGPRLSDYADSIKKDTGIVVARPLEPKKR